MRRVNGYSKVEESEIDKYTGNWLSGAGDRDGGREKRRKEKQCQGRGAALEHDNGGAESRSQES